MFIPNRSMSYSWRSSWWNHEIKRLRNSILRITKFWNYRESFFKGSTNQQLFLKAIYSNKVTRLITTSNHRAMQYTTLFAVKRAGENSTVSTNSFLGLSSYCNLRIGYLNQTLLTVFIISRCVTKKEKGISRWRKLPSVWSEIKTNSNFVTIVWHW